MYFTLMLSALQAGEALGAIGTTDVLAVLEEFCTDSMPEVSHIRIVM